MWVKYNDRITIIGQSLGGHIALDYTIENKEKVDKLVLIDTSALLNKPADLPERHKEAALEEPKLFERLKLLNKVFEGMLADSSRHIPSKAIGFMQVIQQPGVEDRFEFAYECSIKSSARFTKIKTN